MSIVTIPTFMTYLGTELSASEPELTVCLEAAELGVQKACGLGRRFVVATDTTTDVAVVPDGDILRIPDCTAVTAIVENGTAVSSGDYQLEPFATAAWYGEARPYEQVRLLTGRCWYRYGAKATVTVTIKVGWPAIPKAVETAVLMVGKDLRSAKKSDYGVIGFTEYAAVRARENPIVAGLLAGYCRDEAWAL